ncbi:VOC family protein [Streptacidiphilus sp. MAP12-16]|uniref:VOC family protein n=1 Tax=Streptacidiphilus sp. MAP12-16 TaxID=3156300 RepID=UPI0035162A5B
MSLLTPDVAAAQAFYGPLLGWSFETVSEPTGPYAYALTRATKVAGIAALPERWQFPATWTTFFGVTDIAAAARRVGERAGTVGIGPMDFTGGRLAIATDPGGAAFGLWQGTAGPARHLRLPGAPNWVELSTEDAFGAAMFYGSVLDWDHLGPEQLEVHWEHERVVVRVQGHNVAALRTVKAVDGEETAHWHISFAVDDVESATAHAQRLGGRIITPPAPSPYGPTASVRDPHGARFSLIAPL